MIRPATKEDVTCIAEMGIMMWESSSVEELVEEFEVALDNEECAIYLYCIDNTPIGFAQCGLRHDYVEGAESSPVGYLEGIYRSKSHYLFYKANLERWRFFMKLNGKLKEIMEERFHGGQ